VTVVRSYVESDEPDVAKLLSSCVAELGDKRGGQALVSAWLGSASPDDALSRFSSHLSSWSPAYFVASGSSGALGMAACWQREHDGEVMLFVDPAARRAGIGRELLHAALRELRSRGVLQVDAIVTPGDRAFKVLLENTTFKARLLIMRAAL
jgi:GNAT superfamily N-acetyltransferase